MSPVEDRKYRSRGIASRRGGERVDGNDDEGPYLIRLKLEFVARLVGELRRVARQAVADGVDAYCWICV